MCHVLLSITSAKSVHNAQERGNIKPVTRGAEGASDDAQERGNIKPVTRGPWLPLKVRTMHPLSSFRHSVLLASHLGRSLRIDCGHLATRELGPRRLDGFFRFHSIGGDQNVRCDLFLARHRFKRKSRLGFNGHGPSDELKRILVLEGLRGLGWVHEGRLTKGRCTLGASL